MYTCKNCGNYLRFDIASQKMKCDSCNSEFSVPIESGKDMTADVDDYFETKVFTCKNCGGELMGDTNEAVVFCSFCGASNMIEERYEKEKRPNSIIPFQVTKEECKKIYAEKIKKMPFVPKDLQDEKYINSFRAIYMPFGEYDGKSEDSIKARAQNSRMAGNTEYIDTYAYSANLSMNCSGFPHDLSNSFEDDISEAIVPYDISKSVPFSTGYLAGFYGDTSDVEPNQYNEDVKDFMKENGKDVIEEEIRKRRTIDSVESGIKEQIHPEVIGNKIGLYPIWFLSYKKGDRVAYAAINGQTGKITMDAPVSMSRWLKNVILFAIPLFFLFELLSFVAKPRIILGISSAISLASFFASLLVSKALYKKRNSYIEKDGKSPFKEDHKITVTPCEVLLIITFIVSLIIVIINPVQDYIHYSFVGFNIAVVIFCLLILVKMWNIICTRPMPQFKRKGGNDHV